MIAWPGHARDQWVVPPPTTSSSTGGVGFEFFFGTLTVHDE